MAKRRTVSREQCQSPGGDSLPLTAHSSFTSNSSSTSGSFSTNKSSTNGSDWVIVPSSQLADDQSQPTPSTSFNGNASACNAGGAIGTSSKKWKKVRDFDSGFATPEGSFSSAMSTISSTSNDSSKYTIISQVADSGTNQGSATTHSTKKRTKSSSSTGRTRKHSSSSKHHGERNYEDEDGTPLSPEELVEVVRGNYNKLLPCGVVPDSVTIDTLLSPTSLADLDKKATLAACSVSSSDRRKKDKQSYFAKKKEQDIIDALVAQTESLDIETKPEWKPTNKNNQVNKKESHYKRPDVALEYGSSRKAFSKHFTDDSAPFDVDVEAY